MPESAAQPVFIFLPVTRSERDGDGLVVDPVCGRALSDGESAGRLLRDGRHHYFCSLGCAEQFASEARALDSR
jgi:YHS domain-containing protein